MHLPKVNTHLLDASQIEQIAQLLALAFENGSGLSQICNAEGDELGRRLRFLFRTGLAQQATAKQQVLSITQGDRITGAAVIQEPEGYRSLSEKIWGLLQISLGISPVVAWNLWQNLRILEQHHPPQPHYYLMLLGVHPDFIGRGYARALLEALHARSKAHPLSIGVYLETANPKNIDFYRYFGYQLKTQVKIKGIETFIMFRPNSR